MILQTYCGGWGMLLNVLRLGWEGIIPTPRTKYVPRGTFCYYTIYNKVWISFWWGGGMNSSYTIYIRYEI